MQYSHATSNILKPIFVVNIYLALNKRNDHILGIPLRFRFSILEKHARKEHL
jgi:hypothetical protein